MSDLVPSLTLKSHGARVARLHMYDWVILLALMVTDGLLNLIEPFHRFVGRDMMTDLRYPMKGNTVPFWAVPIIGIVGPILIISGIYFKKRNVYDFHHAILGIATPAPVPLFLFCEYQASSAWYHNPTLDKSIEKKNLKLEYICQTGILYSVLITAVITDAIKDAVGRPRPDFFWRCFPDGIDKYNNVTLGVICHGVKSVIKEGHKSFPSGHTSWSFAGLGFCSWYLAGKLKAFDRKGHVGKLCIVIAPLLLAAMVAVSRVDDYWHHWQDVFTGGFLGLTVATFCYLQFFPLPSDDNTIWPHAYHVEILNFRSSNGGAVQTRTNPFTMNNVEMDHTSFASPQSINEYDERDSNPILEAMEAGRRQH